MGNGSLSQAGSMAGIAPGGYFPLPRLPVMKRDLLSLDLPGLEAFVADLGYPAFRGRQLFQWFHSKKVFRPEQMLNLPKPLRAQLQDLLPPFPLETQDSILGRDGTRKIRFRLVEGGGAVESVWIPGRNRSTLCVSSQLGCRMGCRFCRTAGMGWVRHLRPGEILGQVYAVAQASETQDPPVTHVVFMGMGEPMDNLENTLSALRTLTHPLGGCLSPRRITVSTVGIPEAMTRLLREIPVALTVSLNAADDRTRTRLMPYNRRVPLADLCAALQALPLAPRRRITIAYVLIGGENDRAEDARRLARLLHGIRCKVNLIPLNAFPGSDMERPGDSAVIAFQDALRCRGISAHVRFSRGEDILAACGQLASDNDYGSNAS